MKRQILLVAAFAAALSLHGEVTRVFRSPRYDRGMLNQHVCQPIDEAAWVWHPDIPEPQPDAYDIGAFFQFKTGAEAKDPSAFVRFRRTFASDGTPFEIDVSADERFILFLDGRAVARGPNRGWTENWQYQSYRVSVPAGEHVFEAVVLRLGAVAPITQMSCRGGFVFKASGRYDGLLTTGKAAWEVGRLVGTHMGSEFVGHGAMGCRATSTGIGFEDEQPKEWKPAVVVAKPIKFQPSRFNWGLRRPGWMLYPSEIPDQIEVVRRPGAFKSEAAETFAPLLKGARVTVPAHQALKVFWDLDEYYCYYPDLRTSGGAGASVRLSYAESLVDANGKKGNRGEWRGRDVDPQYHMYDTFLPDGRDGACFTSPWWRCGRWMVVEVKTADEPLVIDGLSIRETRYPCEIATAFAAPDDPSLGGIQQICLRSMQNCCHEMLMDCPFYEQQMYPADTRVQMLTLTALSSDDRMIRRCMEIYDLGRRDDGLVPNNWPTRNFQESSVMSLNYVMMYGDYVLWHRNREWLKARFPGVMNTMFAFQREENADGLLENTTGSSFIDWIEDWVPLGKGEDSPIPVGRGEGPSAIENLYYVHALRSAARLSEAVGDGKMADYWRAKADATARQVRKTFWDAGKGLMADDVKHTLFSEHAQIFAILGDVLPQADADVAFGHLTDGTKLARVTVYSLHYLFETFNRYGRGDLILERLDLWRDYLKADLRTCLETPVTYGIQRSDCHAWGSHPIYHLRASVAGIRPDALGFERVRIAPHPGSLSSLKASMPHPSGQAVEVDLGFDGKGGVTGTVRSPVAGVFAWKGLEIPLRAGVTQVKADDGLPFVNLPAGECADVRIEDGVVSVTSTGEVSVVGLTWPRELPRETLVLNDAWERSYGDLEWKDLSATRVSPWYCLGSLSNRTWGVGVETGPGAMCCWEVTTNGTTLVLDLRAGGRPVRLGGRTLRACRIVRADSREGESAWDFGRRFCKLMCPTPNLPKTPVYGYNDWYCAYGKNTATNFLADAAYIMECAKGCANPPYVVMDDGWQRNSPPVVHESGRGPWDAAGPNFGMDMKTFCGKIAALGAKPGLWYRPLRAWDELPDEQRLQADRDYLDPSVPAVRARIVEDMRRFREWGFKLVKIDFLSYDISQLWPCDPHPHAELYIQDDRAWRDSSRTTAEVMLDLYRAMKEAAGDGVVIIGCNALNHLAAGVFELQRTGNDTSGRDWNWTRNHGVNTLAMRSIEDGAFFRIDADCVGLAAEGAVPWRLNGQWMDLLGRSGTPFFVSWRRQLAGPEVRAALSAAFRRAAAERPTAEPLDWMETRTPTRWKDAEGLMTYDWNR